MQVWMVPYSVFFFFFFLSPARVWGSRTLAHVEAFRPLLEWIIADRMCCCFEGYDYGTFCAIYGFSVVDFFLSCLSSGPISSDTTSLFTQRFQVLFFFTRWRCPDFS